MKRFICSTLKKKYSPAIYTWICFFDAWKHKYFKTCSTRFMVKNGGESLGKHVHTLGSRVRKSHQLNKSNSTCFWVFLLILISHWNLTATYVLPAYIYHISDAPWDWNIYHHECRKKFHGFHVGKYSSPMEHLGINQPSMYPSIPLIDPSWAPPTHELSADSDGTTVPVPDPCDPPGRRRRLRFEKKNLESHGFSHEMLMK